MGWACRSRLLPQHLLVKKGSRFALIAAIYNYIEGVLYGSYISNRWLKFGIVILKEYIFNNLKEYDAILFYFFIQILFRNAAKYVNKILFSKQMIIFICGFGRFLGLSML